MEKDKRLIAVENSRSLARVGVQMGLVDKILSDKEDAFLKKKKVILRFKLSKLGNIGDDFKEIEVDENITELYLQNRPFSAPGGHIINLPIEIGQLTNLTKLFLWNNKLTSLPAEIGQLDNLTDLYLGSNELTSLPTEIGQLKNLTKLDLGLNKLTSLPMEIGKLKNLSELILYNNMLMNLPNNIGQLINLKTLDLSNNPISDLEKEKIKHLLPYCDIVFEGGIPF